MFIVFLYRNFFSQMSGCAIRLFLLWHGFIFFQFAWSGVTPQIRWQESDFTGSFQTPGKFSLKKGRARGFGADLHLHFLGKNHSFSFSNHDFNSDFSVISDSTLGTKSFLSGTFGSFKGVLREASWKARIFDFSLLEKISTRIFLGLYSTRVDLSFSDLSGISNRVSSGWECNFYYPFLGSEFEVAVSNRLSLQSRFFFSDLELFSDAVHHQDFEAGLRWFLQENSENLGSFFLGFQVRRLILSEDGSSTDKGRFQFDADGIVTSYRIHF